MKTERIWWEIRNAASKDAADIYLYDEIGAWGISAGEFLAQLRNVSAPKLNVHINSPGGSVFDGFAIYNSLNSHSAKIAVHVDGVAASIASVIAMAGDEINMAENSLMMVHNPLCMCFGFADDLRKQADMLDVLKGNIVGTYSARTGQTPEEISSLMDAETWLTAADAKARGFSTATVAAKQIAAKWDPSAAFGAYKNAPKTFQRLAAPETPSLTILMKKQGLYEASL